VDNETRDILIDRVVVQGETIKAAAQMVNLKYTTAKSVLALYRKKGRVLRRGNCNKNRMQQLMGLKEKLPATFS
jgi:transposase